MAPWLLPAVEPVAFPSSLALPVSSASVSFHACLEEILSTPDSQGRVLLWQRTLPGADVFPTIWALGFWVGVKPACRLLASELPAQTPCGQAGEET